MKSHSNKFDGIKLNKNPDSADIYGSWKRKVCCDKSIKKEKVEQYGGD